MSNIRWGIGISTIAAMGVIGSLVWSNPDQQAFEAYANEQLTDYLETNLCGDLSSSIEQLLNLSCRDLLVQNQDLLNTAIRDNTNRYDFMFFSVYRTTLALPFFGLLPTYQVDTLGIWGHFYLVQAKQR